MSWWFAPFYDQFMKRAEQACVAEWRRELLSGLSGEVLDLGAGTGANVPFFPRAVEHVVAVEPDAAMAKRLRARVRSVPVPMPVPPVPIEVVNARAERLPFADGSFDAVVSTLVLCTVDDLNRALGEIHRVLKPGGALVFIEHVAADTPVRLQAQRLLEPAWRALAGGCHLTRNTDEAIARAGLSFESLTRASIRKAAPLVRPSIRGRALRV